ncbi:hypothetical protein SLE2022_130290 [Rubroshorea leprosula]
MKPNILAPNSLLSLTPYPSLPSRNPNRFPKCSTPTNCLFLKSKPSRFIPICSLNHNKQSTAGELPNQAAENSNCFLEQESQGNYNVQVGSAILPSHFPSQKMSLSDQAFFLLAFIACTTSVAFTSLVIAAVPTLYAMGRAATSLSKLADTAREELPSTMAAIRLSGMEISDLTLELSDLSHEIADGVNKSTKVVRAAEAGIRQIGSLAREQTISMIQERADLPVISWQPVVFGAARKTSQAVGQATKTIINMISGGESSEDDNAIERLDV